MNIHDQHVHTRFSPDSNEEIAEYLKKSKEMGDKYFITTEHLDFNTHYYGDEDIIPDLEELRQELKIQGEKYNIETLLGIECGFRRDLKDKIDAFFEDRDFDLVLLSIHESRTLDVSNPAFYRNRTSSEAYNEYLDLVLDAVTIHDNFDVLAHIDFALRYMSSRIELDEFTQKLKEIFKVLIKKDKALELNTRLIGRYNTLYYTDFMLKLYLSMGGKKLTVSSDSHRVGDFKNHFKRVLPLLKERGVKELYFYKKRTAHPIKI